VLDGATVGVLCVVDGTQIMSEELDAMRIRLAGGCAYADPKHPKIKAREYAFIA